MKKLYEEGRIHAIRVSNFKEHHLNELLADAEVTPVVNQVEYHPRMRQTSLSKYCKEHNIYLEAWEPLMQGKVFEIDLLHEIAKKYNKTVPQIVLCWDIQNGVITIPKSITPERIKSNATFLILNYQPKIWI